MRLSRIQVWSFRSYGPDADDDPPALDLTLSPGVNYLAGLNNAGKSNVLRALAFALDPDAPFDKDVDRSKGSTWGPAVLLEFDAGKHPTEAAQRVLDYADEHERAIEGFQEPSLANEGIVRLYVQQYDTWREERFLTRDSWESAKGGKAGKARQRGIERLRELVQYVAVKSGEDLQGLLRSRFRDILLSAMFDEHAKAMKAAERAREVYWHDLNQMLRPIAKHIQDRIRPYVQGVEEVDLVADVPTVEEALAAARITVTDAVTTSLEHKGTGVRGATLLLLLSFIADSARVPVIFGIEEPEAFLHPDAHRSLGEGLARFTQREDVTLLVTTHSPFLFRAETDSRNAVFRVTKDVRGRSSVVRSAAATVTAELVGSQVIAALLDKVDAVPPRTRLILVVEGETDARYIELAARHLGIAIDDWHLTYFKKGVSTDAERGANGAAVQAVTLGARHAPGRVVAALFDTDEDGGAGYDLLADKFGWKRKKPTDGLFALRYSQWVEEYGVPVEAEDVFEPAVVKGFLDLPGHESFLTGSALRKKSGRWHYDLAPAGKIAFVKWLEEHGTAEVFEPWRPVLEHLSTLATGASAK